MVSLSWSAYVGVVDVLRMIQTDGDDVAGGEAWMVMMMDVVDAYHVDSDGTLWQCSHVQTYHEVEVRLQNCRTVH